MPVCPTCSAELAGSTRCPHCDASGRADVLTSDARAAGAGQAPVADVARRSRTRALVVGAAGLLTVGVAGAAVYAATALGGGGTQPEDVLPADAVGFVKLDLDPSAGQKLAAYRLAQQFPDSGVTSEGTLRDDLLGSLLEGEDEQRYDEDVRPWLGSRAGVAWLPPVAGTSDGPRFVVAVQVTDRAAAQEGLSALADGGPDGPQGLHWELLPDEDYALLAELPQTVEEAVAASSHLAEDEQFTDALAALDGDQIALGWLDLAAAWRTLPEQERAQAVQQTPGLAPEGTVVVGAHVDDDGVEVLGRSLGVSAGDAPELRALLDTSLGRTAPTGLVEQLPGDSAVAVGLTGLGDGLGRLWTTFADELAADEQVTALLDEHGVRLPDDLEALLGSELAVGLGGTLDAGAPRLDLRVRTADPGRAVELLEQGRAAAEAGGVPGLDEVEVTQDEDGYAVHHPAGAASGGGELGDSDVFRRTVPDAGTSGVTYYADVPRLLEMTGAAEEMTAQQRRNTEPVKGAGYTARLEDGGDGTFRLRVTVD